MPAMDATRTDATLRSARTRRMLEDTAVTAVGGGTLVRLELQPRADGSWEAEVRRGDGRLIGLRLDPVRGTVVLRPAAATARDRQVA
jgi:hypothetical protein